MMVTCIQPFLYAVIGLVDAHIAVPLVPCVLLGFKVVDVEAVGTEGVAVVEIRPIVAVRTEGAHPLHGISMLDTLHDNYSDKVMPGNAVR